MGIGAIGALDERRRAHPTRMQQPRRINPRPARTDRRTAGSIDDTAHAETRTNNWSWLGTGICQSAGACSGKRRSYCAWLRAVPVRAVRFACTRVRSSHLDRLGKHQPAGPIECDRLAHSGFVVVIVLYIVRIELKISFKQAQVGDVTLAWLVLLRQLTAARVCG